MKIEPRFFSTLFGILAIHELLLMRCFALPPGISDTLSHPPPDSGPFAYNTFVPPNVPGASYIDPVFGATVRRLSVDHVPDDSYARNMFWNADGTKYLHRTTEGTAFADFWDVLDTRTGQVTHAAIPISVIAADAGFDPVDPNVLYKYVGSTIHKITLLSGGTWSDDVYFTAPDTIKTLGGSLNWLDASGRYMIVRYGSEPSIYLYDRQNLGAGPYANPVDGANTIEAGSYVTITPDGKYLAGYHSGGQYNIGYGISWAVDHFNRSVSTSPVDFWDLCGDHGTFMSTSDGRDYMVINDCANTPELWLADITNNVGGQTDTVQKAAPNNKLLLPASWSIPNGGCGHKSAVAKGPLKDWAFCAGENDDPIDGPVSDWYVYKQEIFAINVMSGQILRLAHHRSRGLDFSYYRYPRLSASWGGEYVGWNSNFNQPDSIDVYVVPFGAAITGGTLTFR